MPGTGSVCVQIRSTQSGRLIKTLASSKQNEEQLKNGEARKTSIRELFPLLPVLLKLSFKVTMLIGCDCQILSCSLAFAKTEH